MVRSSFPAGIGALGSAKARFFHPSAKIREKYPRDDKSRLRDVLVTGEGRRKVNKKMQDCYLVRIPEFDDGTEFHIVKKNFKVDAAPAVPFPVETRETAATRNRQSDEQTNLLRAADRNVVPNVGIDELTGAREEVDELRRQGITVDDDNEPAPENAEQDNRPANGRWEKPQICPRRMTNVGNTKGQFVHHRWDEIVEMDELTLFRMCFPEEYIINIVIPETNKHLTTKLTLQEFYVWLGCYFFMACFNGIPDREMWWSTTPISKFEGAPFRLNEYISRNRFLEITYHIRYTSKEEPLFFVDKFHEVREMLEAFNEHYARNYRPSWMNCIDESMNSWLNKFCPGFMFLPRKPWPFGNEYHTIADGDDGKTIMWRVKLVEGKDRPKLPNGRFAFPSKWEEKGYKNTVELLLDMTEPIHRTGKVVTGDSGFCVADGIVALDKVGVYGQFLIKKRRYWPKGVPGDYLDEHMNAKSLGETETYVQEIDGVRFLVHCCRDADYVTKIMSSHGTLEENQDHATWRKVDGEWKTFQYAEPFSRHNRGKHWVDDVNQRRHQPISLESVWATKWWPNRQFTFILSVAEVNAGMARARARKEPAQPMLEFRRQLAMRMLENKLDERGVAASSPIRPRRASNMVHILKKREKFRGKWDSHKRQFKRIKTEYLVRPCSVCRKSTREYCLCAPGADLCRACFGAHLVEHGG
jgi:hypothetical protein